MFDYKSPCVFLKFPYRWVSIVMGVPPVLLHLIGFSTKCLPSSYWGSSAWDPPVLIDNIMIHLEEFIAVPIHNVHLLIFIDLKRCSHDLPIHNIH